MASSLKLKIDISDEDIAAQFEEFQNCYPEGKISEEEFLEIFSKNNVFSPNSLFRFQTKLGFAYSGFIPIFACLRLIFICNIFSGFLTRTGAAR